MLSACYIVHATLEAYSMNDSTISHASLTLKISVLRLLREVFPQSNHVCLDLLVGREVFAKGIGTRKVGMC
jgi:hypothetical protein